MIIHVKVKPGSKEERLEKISETEYIVSLKERAEDGRANRRLINLLAKEFSTNFQSINIKNPKSRNKIVEVMKGDEVRRGA